MSNDIVLHKQDMDELQELGQALVASGFFKDSTKVAQAAVKVLAGRELGLGPVESMRAFHIVEGKIEMSADLLAQRVKAHPKYDYRVRKLDNYSAAIEFFEDGESLGLSEFTMDDAASAGLAGRGAWKTYSRNMLFARAISNGVAWFCPDVAGGSRLYVEGEVGGPEPSYAEVNGHVVDVTTGEIVESSEAGASPNGASSTTTVSEEYSDPVAAVGEARRAGSEMSEATASEEEPPGPPIGTVAGEAAVDAPLSSSVPGDIREANRSRSVSENSTVKQRQALAILAKDLGMSDDQRHELAGVESFRDLTKAQASALFDEWGAPGYRNPFEEPEAVEPEAKMVLYARLVQACHDHADGRIVTSITKALNRPIKASEVPAALTEDDLLQAIAFVEAGRAA